MAIPARYASAVSGARGKTANSGVEVRRRALLAVAAGPVIGVSITACTGAAPGKRAARDSGNDPDERVRWNAVRSEQAMLALHAAAAAKHADLGNVLGEFAEHHRLHLAALLNEGPFPLLALPEAASTAGPGTTSLPDDPDAALRAIRDAELSTRDAHLADCLFATGPRLAALLASIAAAEATHGALLESA